MHKKPEPLSPCAGESFELVKNTQRSDRGSKIRQEGKVRGSRKNRTDSMSKSHCRKSGKDRGALGGGETPSWLPYRKQCRNHRGGECREHKEGHLCVM